jgi:hypothetical protein
LGPSGAAEILDQVLTLLVLNAGVTPRHRRVVHDHVVVRDATELDLVLIEVEGLAGVTAAANGQPQRQRR